MENFPEIAQAIFTQTDSYYFLLGTNTENIWNRFWNNQKKSGETFFENQSKDTKWKK
jgi:hypothetical protein